MQWEISGIQLVSFGPIIEVQKPELLYERIFGERPPNFGQETTPVGTVAKASGIIGGNACEITYQSQRLDVLVRPQIPPDAIVDAEKMLALVSEGMASPSLVHERSTRLSVVLASFQRCTSLQEAVKKAADSIGIELPFDDGSDFRFQLNRRAKLPSMDRDINRVIALSILGIRNFNLHAGANPTFEDLGGEEFLFSAQADVNTALPASPIVGLEIPEVLKELAKEAWRLATAPSISALSHLGT